jgi:Flp pilus assembly protein CpaB
VLALLAAVGVIVYTNSVKTNAVVGSGAVNVLVSKQDISANTALNPLISQGVFETITVPKDAVVSGAVTDESELQNQTTSAPIYANEQIPVSRLSSANNLLGISEGHVGLGLQVGGPQSVNGYIQNADQVVVYVTFNRGTVVSNQTLKQLLSPAQIQKFYDAIASNGTSSSSLASSPALVLPFDFTMTLVKSVKVLSIQNPSVDTSTGRSTTGNSIMVLDATPEDAQQIIFASSQGALYLGLLPQSNKTGYDEPAAIGVPITKVIGAAKP